MAAPDLFSSLEAEYQLPSGLLDSVWNAESSRGQNMQSPAGAQGHFQFMPATAAQYGVTDPNDLAISARGAARYLRDLIDQTGGLDSGLAAYNWGLGNLKRKGIENAPTETRNYIEKVKSGMAQESDPWAALGKQFSQYAPQAPDKDQEEDPWRELASQYAAPQADAAPVAPAPTAVTPTGTGVNSQEFLSSRTGRFLKGAKDIADGGAQFLVHALPSGVVDAVNSAAKSIDEMPVIGPIASALGVTPATTEQIDNDIQTSERQYQDARKAAGQSGIDGYRIVGNYAGSLPMFYALPQTAASLPGQIGLGAANGAFSSLFSPVTNGGDYWLEKGKQGLLGSAFGAGGATAARGVSSILAPKAATNPQIQGLLAEGVTPTPGQLGPQWLRTLEDHAMSLPLVGPAISSARQRSIDQLNKAALNRAVEPVGGKVSNIGRQGVDEAQQAIGKAYDDLTPSLGLRADDQLAQELATIRAMAEELPEAQAKQLKGYIDGKIVGKLTPQGYADGVTFREMERGLGNDAAKYLKSLDPDQQNLGSAYLSLQQSLREALERSNPQQANQLRDIHTAFRNLVPVQRAASSVAAENGVFSPAQLASGVRAADSSVRKGKYAAGKAVMQDLSDAGYAVLRGKVPNSGSPERLLSSLAVLGGAFTISPLAAYGLLGATLPYMPILGRGAAAALAKRPDAAIRAGGLLPEYAPAIGGFLGLTGAGVTQ